DERRGSQPLAVGSLRHPHSASRAAAGFPQRLDRRRIHVCGRWSKRGTWNVSSSGVGRRQRSRKSDIPRARGHMAKRAVALLYGVLGACGGESNAGLTPDGRGGAWNIVISPGNLTLAQGQSGTLTISIVGNTKSPVSLSLGFLPDSVTGTFSTPVLNNSSATS